MICKHTIDLHSCETTFHYPHIHSKKKKEIKASQILMVNIHKYAHVVINEKL